jgi:hypothetical protein
MEQNGNFQHELIKGKIAELIFELMFRETGKFTALRFGYEYTLPELAQYQHLLEVKRVLDNISNSPDFILIKNEKNSEGKLEVFTVEVKYRREVNLGEMKEIAKDTLKTWDPSWLFIATPDCFYFTACRRILDSNGEMWRLTDNWVSEPLKKKYLELLRDFEIDH